MLLLRVSGDFVNAADLNLEAILRQKIHTNENSLNSEWLRRSRYLKFKTNLNLT